MANNNYIDGEFVITGPDEDHKVSRVEPEVDSIDRLLNGPERSGAIRTIRRMGASAVNAAVGLYQDTIDRFRSNRNQEAIEAPPTRLRLIGRVTAMFERATSWIEQGDTGLDLEGVRRVADAQLSEEPTRVFHAPTYRGDRRANNTRTRWATNRDRTVPLPTAAPQPAEATTQEIPRTVTTVKGDRSFLRDLGMVSWLNGGDFRATEGVSGAAVHAAAGEATGTQGYEGRRRARTEDPTVVMEAPQQPAPAVQPEAAPLVDVGRIGALTNAAHDLLAAAREDSEREYRERAHDMAPRQGAWVLGDEQAFRNFANGGVATEAARTVRQARHRAAESA